MSKIKGYITAIVTFVIGLLTVIIMGQRNKVYKAEDEKRQAERDLSQKQKQQEKTKAVGEAQSQARQENVEYVKEKRSQSKAERRSGKFGSGGRVR